MLEIYRYGEKISVPCALVLGGFDGLHLGHRALLREAKKTGLPVVITTMLGAKGSALFTKEERAFIFDHTAIDFVYEIPFTDELKNTSFGRRRFCPSPRSTSRTRDCTMG